MEVHHLGKNPENSTQLVIAPVILPLLFRPGLTPVRSSSVAGLRQIAHETEQPKARPEDAPKSVLDHFGGEREKRQRYPKVDGIRGCRIAFQLSSNSLGDA